MLFVCTLLILPVFAFAQAPDTAWTRTYGGAENDVAYSVMQTSDNNLIVVGFTESYGAGGKDVHIIKVNRTNGDTIWTKTYGGSENDEGRSVDQTTDGGYFITGITNIYQYPAGKMYSIKTNSFGDTLWTKTYGNGDGWRSYSGEQIIDEGYIVCGSTHYKSGSAHLCVKIDVNGDTMWYTSWGGMACGDEGYDMHQTSDGSYITTGINAWPFPPYYRGVSLAKIDTGGTVLWRKKYEPGTGLSVQQTSDGGYIIAGAKGFDEERDVYLIKTDSNGDTVWTRTYGGDSADVAFSVRQTSDDGYILTGYTRSFGAGGSDVWLVRTDSSGDSIWAWTYGRTEDDDAYSIQRTNDGGYIIAGHTKAFGAGNSDFWLLKIEPDISVTEDVTQTIQHKWGSTILMGPILLPESGNHRIFDITGRQIHTLDPAPGIYFIQVDGKIQQKVIKIK